MTPKKPKKKLRKGEQVWWTIAHSHELIMHRCYRAKYQCELFIEVTGLSKKIFKPVKIIVRLA